MAYIRITGTVDTLHKKGNGFRIREDFTKRDGTEGHTWSTVFPKDDTTPSVIEGQKVTVSGTAGASAYIKDDGTATASVVVNYATVELGDTEPEPEPF